MTNAAAQTIGIDKRQVASQPAPPLIAIASIILSILYGIFSVNELVDIK